MRRLIFLLIMVLVVSIAGCGGTEPAPDPDKPGPAPDQTTPADTDPGGPRSGGTAVMGIWSEPGNLNPLLTTSGYEMIIHEVVFNGLIRANELMEPVPDLAESWEVSADGRTVTFTLHEGITWHDGTPLTAHDVAFSLESLAHPDYVGTVFAFADSIAGARARREGEADSISGVNVLDDRRIAISTPEPTAALFTGLMQIKIVPRHVLESVPPEEWYRHEFNTDLPIGSGPMRLTRREPGSHMEFEAHDGHFMGRPHLDRLIIRVGDQNTMMAAFSRQEVDMVQVPVTEIEMVRDLAHAEIMVYDELNYQVLDINQRKPEFADIRVRQAMMYATNREQIVNSLLRGYAQVVHGPSPRGVWAYPPDIKEFPYDPDRARELLEEAGFTLDGGVRTGDGVTMEYELLYPTGLLVRMQTAPIIQQNFEAVGIKLDLRAVDFPTLASRLMPADNMGNPRALNADDLDLWLLGLGMRNGDPGMLRMFFHSDFGPPRGHNFRGYANSRVDELLDLLDGSTDAEQRQVWAHEMIKIIGEEVGCVPLFNSQDIWVVNTRVHGFSPGNHGKLANLVELWIDN